MFNNLKIGVRLGIGFAVTLVLLVAVAIIGFTRLTSLNDSTRQDGQRPFPEDGAGQRHHRRDQRHRAACCATPIIYSGAEQQKALDGIPAQRKIITDNLEKLEKIDQAATRARNF